MFGYQPGADLAPAAEERKEAAAAAAMGRCSPGCSCSECSWTPRAPAAPPRTRARGGGSDGGGEILQGRGGNRRRHVQGGGRGGGSQSRAAQALARTYTPARGPWAYIWVGRGSPVEGVG